MTDVGSSGVRDVIVMLVVYILVVVWFCETECGQCWQWLCQLCGSGDNVVCIVLAGVISEAGCGDLSVGSSGGRRRYMCLMWVVVEEENHMCKCSRGHKQVKMPLLTRLKSPTRSSSKTRSADGVKRWFRHIQEAQEAYAARDGRRHRPHATTPLPDPDDQSTPPTDTLQDVDDNVEVEGEAGGEGVGDSSQDASRAQLGTSRTSEQGKADDASGQTSPPSPDTLAKKTAEAVGGSGTPTPSPPAPTPSRSPAQGRRLQEVQIIQIVEGPTLIQPSEVKVSQGLVFSAQPVLTPIEHLRRKDLKIRQALEEKQLLIADILNIPHEHFESVIDMAGEPAVGNKEPKELVLAAMFQAKCLQETLNEVLSINEGDIVAARANSDSRPPPSVTNLPLYQAPMTKLLGISTTLSQQLSSLLNLVSERDDERERMRKELVASRERLHQLHMRQNSTTTSTTQPSSATPPVGAPPPPPAASPHTSRPNSFVSVASSAADHSDTPEHHDTDEDGSGEGGKINMEEADQAKEESAHEVSDVSVCGADASGSKSGEVEDTPQAEVGCEEGPGGDEGGGETSTT